MKPALSSLQVRVPGKLILSGEHAVVYGYPALAMAIDKHVTATVSRDQSSSVSFDLHNLAHRSQLTLDKLSQLKNRIKRKYHRFVNGEYSIRQVLHKPFELAQFALGLFAEAAKISPHGLNIHVSSDIPVGCGMGSSAATILSVLTALSHYLEIPLTQEAIYKMALEAEHMQHGKSSGLDIRVAMRGGCFYLHKDQLLTRPSPRLNMFLVNTGAPVSSTGQCVEAVAPFFKSGSIGESFAAVTMQLDNALQVQNKVEAMQAIRENHVLLNRIKVVPAKVGEFISQVEQVEGAAKVCGAGAVAGSSAGIVLVVIDDSEWLLKRCSAQGFTVMPVSCEERGAYVVV